MITIKSDGIIFTARTATLLVEQLNDFSFARCDTAAEFMREHALRAYETNEDMIRADTPENYLEDCIKYGIYELVSDTDRQPVKASNK